MERKAFTLVELLLVVAIMGLMGSVSVGGYRAMRRGMEERGVMENANQFIRSAYQRAIIDRQPTAIYFWNETLREATDTEELLVVGRAVAVRRSGRWTAIDGKYLVDEFGDLSAMVPRDDEGQPDEAQSIEGTEKGNGMYLYRMNGNESQFQRSLVSQFTKPKPQSDALLIGETSEEIPAYGFYCGNKGGIAWKVGDAYGFEFEELRLTENYIFNSDFSRSLSSAVKEISVMTFSPDGTIGGGSITVSVLRPDNGGALQAKKVATTESPKKDRE